MKHRPMHIQLSGERRERMVSSLQAFFSQEIDVPLSDFQANNVLDFFVRELGAPVYNQAIQDARGFVQESLDDLGGEFYEPEDPYSR